MLNQSSLKEKLICLNNINCQMKLLDGPWIELYTVIVVLLYYVILSDEMEFEISSDQRTGKQIACRVIRLEPGSVSFEVCLVLFLILLMFCLSAVPRCALNFSFLDFHLSFYWWTIKKFACTGWCCVKFLIISDPPDGVESLTAGNVSRRKVMVLTCHTIRISSVVLSLWQTEFWHTG